MKQQPLCGVCLTNPAENDMMVCQPCMDEYKRLYAKQPEGKREGEMSTRRVLAEMETERQVQDIEHGGPEHDDTLTRAQWIAILCRHLGLACDDEGQFDPVRYRKQLIRVGATCCAAVEAFDREHGCEHGAGRRPEDRGPEY